MISIKSVVAIVALGTALVAAPAFAVTHSVKPTTTTHKHSKVHSPAHKHVAVSHKSKHVSTKAVHSSKNKAGKSHATKGTAGWKHHHSV